MSVSPVFTRHDDGRVTVDKFPPEIWVSGDLLAGDADPAIVSRAGFRSFAIRCANAAATYRIVRRFEYSDVFLCRRVA